MGGWLLLEDYSDVKDRDPPLRGFFKNDPPTTSRKKREDVFDITVHELITDCELVDCEKKLPKVESKSIGGRTEYQGVRSGEAHPAKIVFINMNGVNAWVMTIKDEVHAKCSDKSRCPLGDWTSETGNEENDLRVTCLAGECPEFAPVDCIMEEWSKWTPCSRRCDEGTAQRKRGIRQKDAYNGKKCERQKEIKKCDLRPCRGVDKTFAGNWGTWGRWSDCPKGSYVVGFRLKTEEDQGWWNDDSAANNIHLRCRKPGSSRTTRVIGSKAKTWGDWSGYSHCEGLNNPVVGFQVRNESPGGDDTSINDVKMICKDGSKTIKVSAKTSWGEWSDKNVCQTGYAVVGIMTRFDQGGALGSVGYDDTALNGIKVRCEYYVN